MNKAQKMAEKALKEVIKGGKIIGRKDCEYYPCHFEGQDCTFCFCPFYPCKDYRTGGKFKSSGIWSCMDCYIIHRTEVAYSVLRALRSNSDLKNIWKEIMEPKLGVLSNEGPNTKYTNKRNRS